VSARVVSQVHRIPRDARRAILLVDDDPVRLSAWTECLARNDRVVVAALGNGDAFGALAAGFRPGVIVASVTAATEVFARVSAMPRFWNVRFVSVAEDGFESDPHAATERLARLVSALLEELPNAGID
jgi:hypothetical protein